MGLLTGNWADGARKKLDHCGLLSYFQFGAFAEDGPEREKLFTPAIRRAEVHTGHEYAPPDVWVIGDTPHDVRCGALAGASTLGVATGPYSEDDLMSAGATAVIESFECGAEAVSAIFEGTAA